MALIQRARPPPHNLMWRCRTDGRDVRSERIEMPATSSSERRPSENPERSPPNWPLAAKLSRVRPEPRSWSGEAGAGYDLHLARQRLAAGLP